MRQHVEARAVRHRRGVDDGVARRDRVDVGKIVEDRRHHVLLRQRHALGAAGGAAGVEQPGRVLARRARPRPWARRARARRSAGRPRRSTSSRPATLAVQRRHRVVQLGGGEAQARAAVLQDEFEFARMQLGVDRHRAQARVPAGEQQLDVLRAVLHHQRDAVVRGKRGAMREPGSQRATRARRAAA